MKNNKRKTKITAIIMLLTLVLTLFSACADSSVQFTAEMPTVESVVGYSADIETVETSTDSVVKLSETSTWDGATATYEWYEGKSSPYTISSASDLAGLANIVNGTDSQTADTFSGDKITLACDIILNTSLEGEPYEWTAIGTNSNSFQGTFDGGGNTISGLYINSTDNISTVYVGLFGYVSSGTVKNVGVINSSITVESTSSITVGGVVGYNKEGAVSNCYFTGNVYGVGYNANVGGIVGQSNKGTVSSCYNFGDISSVTKQASGNVKVGGVVGFSGYIGSKVLNCYNEGAVSGKTEVKADVSVGGVVGYTFNDAVIISNCYNVGDVDGYASYDASANAYIGGVVGYNVSGTISNSYSTGGVSDSSSSLYNCIGSIVGKRAGTVTNCYAISGVATYLIGSDGSSSTSTNVTTFDGTGALLGLTGDAYSSCETLLSALNAYVDEDNGTNDLIKWELSGESYELNSAPVIFVTPVATYVDGAVIYTIYDDGSSVATTAGTNAAGVAVAIGTPSDISGWTALYQSETEGYLSLTDGGTKFDEDYLPEGNYYLAEDVDISYTISIGDNVSNNCYTVNLNLNGHVINMDGNYRIFYIYGTSNDESTLNLYGDDSTNIYDSTAEEIAYSGGLITGGNITGSSGGGVFLGQYTSFNMYGGTITGNQASSSGGGVYVGSDSTFNMYGGTITGNTASEYGGGVYVGSDSTFNMYGGTISDNTAGEYGGGVYGAFSVSGSPVISENTLTDGKANNVYLTSGNTIIIDGTLTEGASIGVTMADGEGQFTAVETAVESDAEYFFSDSDGYELGFDSENNWLALSEIIITSSSSSSSSSSKLSASVVASLNGETAEEEVEEETPAETVAPSVTVTPSVVETEIPSIIPDHNIDTDPATNGGYAVWIVLAVIVLGVVGYVVYRNKGKKG